MRRGRVGRRRLSAVAGLAGALSLVGACRPPAAEPPTLLSGATMGTTWSVRLATVVEPERAQRLQALVERQLDEVDSTMSTWREESELSRLNTARTTDPVELSDELFKVVAEGVRVGRLTDGAFDITVGPLVNAFGFGPAAGERLPTEMELNALRERTGLGLLELDPQQRSARKLHAELYLDLSGIAKGYAVDRVAEALADEGLADLMVEVGGEVRTLGRNADDQPWRIGLERPDDVRGAIERVLPLSDMALATSGDYRNFRIVDGRRLTHILDPRTGEPVHHALASATVLHESCATADALATAMIVLGPDEALAVAERLDLAVLLLVRDGDGFTERRSSSFPRQSAS